MAQSRFHQIHFTGTSPIIFGSGYLTLGTWWRVGFVMSVMQLLI